MWPRYETVVQRGRAVGWSSAASFNVATVRDRGATGARLWYQTLLAAGFQCGHGTRPWCNSRHRSCRPARGRFNVATVRDRGATCRADPPRPSQLVSMWPRYETGVQLPIGGDARTADHVSMWPRYETVVQRARLRALGPASSGFNVATVRDRGATCRADPPRPSQLVSMWPRYETVVQLPIGGDARTADHVSMWPRYETVVQRARLRALGPASSGFNVATVRDRGAT